MTQSEFVDYVREKAKQRPLGSVNKAAKAWGLSQSYLSAIVNRKRTPGPKILRALGYEVVADYRKKCMADGGSNGNNV